MGSKPKSQELSLKEGGGVHEPQLTCNGLNLHRGGPQAGLPQLDLCMDGLGFSCSVEVGPDLVLIPVNVGPPPTPRLLSELKRSLGKGSCFPSAVS